MEEELIKEVYARFGLAYYYGECLHKQLCTIYTLADYKDQTEMTKQRIEEKLKYASSLTLGILIKEILHLIPNHFYNNLTRAVKKRNFLAHHFWFERAHLFLTQEGIIQMINELDEHANCYQQIDRELTSTFKDSFDKLGLTEDLVNQSMKSILEGGKPEPLPSKRKLKKMEKIIAAWNVLLPENKIVVLFETEDNELWQLCDVGLGWTDYKNIKPDWKKDEVLSKYLPTEIDPRPGINKHWDYYFKLSKDKILLVTKDPIGRSVKCKIVSREPNHK